MTSRKSAARPCNSRNTRSEHLKDEVYRQMFRLEEGRAGAETGLALALIRAWLASGSKAESGEEREWLMTISPICLVMIENASQAGGAARPCSQ